MFSLKTHAVISAGLFAAMIAGAVAGNVAHESGLVVDGTSTQFGVMVVFFALFIAFGYSLMPLMVKIVLRGQAGIGNANVGLVQAVARHETKIIVGFWLLITAGLAVAIPAAVHDGFFQADPAAQIAATPSRGTLVARPGIPIDVMRRQSSLAIKGALESVFADGNLFDFTIAGTGITFHRCRYYYMTTLKDDRTRIGNISIGTAQAKMSRAQLAALNDVLRTQLAADGWLVAYAKTRTEEQRRFHGGAAGRANNDLWLNGDIVLRIMSRRLDDAKAGEDAAAGEWIQYVELSARQYHSGIESYEFAKPQ